jgi:uncharacterized protein
VPADESYDVNRRQFLKLGAIAGASAATGVGGYTWLIEPHWERIVERDLVVANLPAGLVGARLVQISDIHVGPRVDDDYLVEALGRTAALRPDIVVMTGDFIDRSSPRAIQFDQLRDVLTHFPRGRLATLGILGNHDYGRAWSQAPVAARVVAEAERAGVRMLRNEVATVDGLDVVGVDDLWAHRSDPTRALAARMSDASLVLCHNPDTLDELPWGDYKGWVLAGHTHGGQCKPPFLPPPILPVRNKRYAAGEVALADGRRLYINRGLGHLLQVRFNVRPEITAFTLRRAG